MDVKIYGKHSLHSLLVMPRNSVINLTVSSFLINWEQFKLHQLYFFLGGEYMNVVLF